MHVIHLGIFGGEDHDGDVGFRAQVLADGKPVGAGHHDVEHDQVGFAHGEFGGQLIAGGERLNVEPRVFQECGKHFKQARIVICQVNQRAHCFCPLQHVLPFMLLFAPFTVNEKKWLLVQFTMPLQMRCFKGGNAEFCRDSALGNEGEGVCFRRY